MSNKAVGFIAIALAASSASNFAAAASFTFQTGAGTPNNVGDTVFYRDHDDAHPGFVIRHSNGNFSDLLTPPGFCLYDGINSCKRDLSGFNDKDQILITEYHYGGDEADVRLYTPGKWTTITDLNKQSQAIGTGLNDAGTALVTDSYLGSGTNTITDSYVYQNGKLKAFYDPQGKTSTYAAAINNRGEIVGHFAPSANSADGFTYINGKFTTLNYPGATYTFLSYVNGSGEVVGEADFASTSVWFLYDGTTFHSLNFPGASPEHLHITGLNDSGAVIGYYDDSNGENPISFLYENGVFSSLVYPGASSTQVSAITNSGQIYGEAWNATNDYYFIATLQSETPEPGTTIPTLVALGLFAGFFLYRRKNSTP